MKLLVYFPWLHYNLPYNDRVNVALRTHFSDKNEKKNHNKNYRSVVVVVFGFSQRTLRV